MEDEMLKETGIEELRRLVGVAGRCRESALDPFTAEETLKLFRACWASPWDLYPDQLTEEERRFAAKHGRLSAKCNRRLDKDFGDE